MLFDRCNWRLSETKYKSELHLIFADGMYVFDMTCRINLSECSDYVSSDRVQYKRTSLFQIMAYPTGVCVYVCVCVCVCGVCVCGGGKYVSLILYRTYTTRF